MLPILLEQIKGHINAVDVTEEGWQTDLTEKISQLCIKFNDPTYSTDNSTDNTLHANGDDSAAKFFVGDKNDEDKLSDTTDISIQVEDAPPLIESLSEETDEDNALLADLLEGRSKHRELEQKCATLSQAVSIRRKYIERIMQISLERLPHQHYDYKMVYKVCCENPIGYVQIPTGIVGPLLLNGRSLFVPMATTEGALVASVNRGCSAIQSSGGVKAFITNDGMTRAPVLKFKKGEEANHCKEWIRRNFAKLKATFDGTSRFARLKEITTHLQGKLLHIRFEATTGDAMGMNMVTKAARAAVEIVREHYPNTKLISLSGNMCVDKKAGAINWIMGRGKSVTAEATIPPSVVARLKTSVDEMVTLGNAKLQNGSLNAATIGGSNAQAANVVAAIFLATGQDAAQVVSSSMCHTELEKTEEGDLSISCTMNCLEVGTVGGGTNLKSQQAMLELLGCCGSHPSNPGDNAKQLAMTICATVLAGELSLLAAQCSDDLVTSHMMLNRSQMNLARKNVSAQPFHHAFTSTALSNIASATANNSRKFLADSCHKGNIPVNCSSAFN